jgi:hypothetical protein
LAGADTFRLMTDPFIRPLGPDARAMVELEGRPLERYAVMLQLRIDGRWQTVRLLDNAHGHHDMHRYTGSEKQPAEGSNRGVMEELERSKFTAAGEIANERLVEIATDPDRYPAGAAIIAADQEHFGEVLAEAVADHRPVAIVYPDGREIVAAPRGGPLAYVEHFLARRRAAGERKGSVPLPADYRVEVRDRQPLAAA